MQDLRPRHICIYVIFILSYFQEELDAFVSDGNTNTPYWKVRKAVVLLAFFGGLRKTEAEALKLEDIVSSSEGVHVTHSRKKNKEVTNFVPNSWCPGAMLVSTMPKS